MGSGLVTQSRRASGSLVDVNFTVNAAVREGDFSSLSLSDFEDDLAGATTTAGTFSVPDITLPIVMGKTPTGDLVSPLDNITVIFSEPMDKPATEGAFSIFPDVPGGTLTWRENTMVFTPPAAGLDALTTYIVTISTAARDLAGNKLARAFSWSFTTLYVDVIPPFVEANYPAHEATEVSLATLVMATFSEPMDKPATEGAGSIFPDVPGTLTWSENTMVFTPAADLATLTLYTVTISTAARDLAGNLMEYPKTWDFTTAAIADGIPPQVVETGPVDKATNVPVATNITITFNESMRFLATEGAASISPDVPGVFTWSAGSVILTFTPVENLSPGTRYTITVSTEATDSAGNPLAKEHSFSFTTAALPPPPPPDPDKLCFIATAAFDTPLAEEVKVLRRFRDQYLLTNELGRRFVSLYYRHSPALAGYISNNEQLKSLVRMGLRPLARIAEFILGGEEGCRL